MDNAWENQVEIKLDSLSAGERLRRIETWCTDWQIGFRVSEQGPSVVATGRNNLVICIWRNPLDG